MKIKNKYYLIFVIAIVCLYHYQIQNSLEKMFSYSYFNYDDIKRPSVACANDLKEKIINIITKTHRNCVGMPSGHAETITILSSLLHFYEFIPLWLCILLIFCVSIQRIISNMHTFIQVITGIIIGYIYFNIYTFYNLSVYSILIVLCIGFIIALLIIYKLDLQLHKLLYINHATSQYEKDHL